MWITEMAKGPAPAIAGATPPKNLPGGKALRFCHKKICSGNTDLPALS